MKYLLLIGMLCVTACGFHPVYGTKHQTVLPGGVRVETPRDAMGHRLKNSLEAVLNPYGIPEKPAYRLVVTVVTSQTPVGVARDGTVGRYNTTLASDYQLIDLSNNAEVAKGKIYHVSSFNNQSNQYLSTYVSQQDSIRRGIDELSQLYRQRLAAWYVQQSGKS